MRTIFALTAVSLVAAALAAAGAEAPAPDSAGGLMPAELLKVKRLFVDRIGGGQSAEQIRDMIIGSLQRTRLFVITENQEKADAWLKGSAEDLIYNEVHNTSDSISARTQISTGRSSRDANSRYAGASIGERESSRITERRHEASAAVRLVNRDGDVIWSTTQESLGGKFRGSSADVADKITRRLVEDYERAQKAQAAAQSEKNH